MAVEFYISRGEKSNKEHIKILEQNLAKKNKSFLELGLYSKMSVLGAFKRGESDCLIIYDTEKFGDILQKSLVRTLYKTSLYKSIYIFIEVLDSGYDFTYSPLYNAYSFPERWYTLSERHK